MQGEMLIRHHRQVVVETDEPPPPFSCTTSQEDCRHWLRHGVEVSQEDCHHWMRHGVELELTPQYVVGAGAFLGATLVHLIVMRMGGGRSGVASSCARLFQYPREVELR